MLRVGLTGGVGSGKSVVADMLLQLGARVSRSDEIGRALMQRGQPVLKAIAAHFGPHVLTADGAPNRAELARIAFKEGLVEELNALVHPVVIAAQNRWMEKVAEEDNRAVAVVESALIFETRHGDASQTGMAAAPWRSRFDRIVVVTAPEPLRRQRYIARVCALDPAITREAAADDFYRRVAAQWSDERKAALADVILRNEGSLDDLRSTVEGLYASLRQESLRRCST